MVKLVKWDENNIGTVNKKAFAEGLPEGLTIDHFQQVDQYRENHLTEVSTLALNHADENNIGDGSGTGLSIPDIYLGGQTRADIHISNDGRFVAEVNSSYTDELMGAVISRSQELWAKYNVIELKKTA